MDLQVTGQPVAHQVSMHGDNDILAKSKGCSWSPAWLVSQGRTRCPMGVDGYGDKHLQNQKPLEVKVPTAQVSLELNN